MLQLLAHAIFVCLSKRDTYGYGHAGEDQASPCKLFYDVGVLVCANVCLYMLMCAYTC